MALILRKKKDGSVHVDGSAPDYHEFATRFLGRLVEELGGRVEVVVVTAEGDVTYEIERAITADPERETSPVVAYAARRVGTAAKRKRGQG